MIKIPKLKQTDPKWSRKKLGPHTLGSQGCLITCLSMYSHNTGHNLKPGKLVDELNKVNAITSDGELIWKQAEKALQGMHFLGRFDTDINPGRFSRFSMNSSIERIHHLIDLGQPVFVNVDNLHNDGRPDHWVLLVDKFWRPYNMHDPAGDCTSFEAVYGSPEKGLYGWGAMLGPALTYPASYRAGVRHAAWKLLEHEAGRDKNNIYIKEAIHDLTNP